MASMKRKGDNFEGSVSIGRCNHGYINIRIRDKASRGDFVDVRMSAEDFAGCITGLAEQDVVGSVKGLEYVGKNRITEARQALYPGKSYDKVMLAQWLRDNKQEDGWILSTYLNSQSSIQSVDGGTQLNYSVTKYVDNVEK